MMCKTIEYICTLDKSINCCSHFDGNLYCNNTETKCGMLRIQDNSKKNHVRKEKWFDKYYK